LTASTNRISLEMIHDPLHTLEEPGADAGQLRRMSFEWRFE